MALPNQIDPGQPPDTQDISLGAARIREFRQAIIDILGLPSATNITQALFAADAAGLKKITLADNAADPTVDGQITRNGSTIKARIGGVVYTIVPPGGLGGPARPMDQVRLIYTAGTVQLRPSKGNQLAFPAGIATVPIAGVSLGPGGLLTSTTYFIYAVQTNGVVTSIEASTNPYGLDSGTGIAVRTAFPTRALVGMARTTAAGGWSDTDNARLVLSYHNRRTIRARGAFTTNRQTASLTPVEIHSEIRVDFLTWADEAVLGSLSGYVSNNGPNSQQTYLTFDAVSEDSPVTGGVADANFSLGVTAVKSLTEGYHQASLYGNVSAGTGTWAGGTHLWLAIRG